MIEMGIFSGRGILPVHQDLKESESRGTPFENVEPRLVSIVWIFFSNFFQTFLFPKKNNSTTNAFLQQMRRSKSMKRNKLPLFFLLVDFKIERSSPSTSSLSQNNQKIFFQVRWPWLQMYINFWKF